MGIDTAAFEQGISRAQKQMAAVGQKLTSVGKGMTAGITAPIVAFGGLALKVAGDFEAGMNQVAAVSGATGDQLKALREQAKELGATTQFSASDAAEAMGFLAMAGMKTNEILAAMPETLKLASAAQLDMGAAADIVTNILAGYNKDVSELGAATDVLVKSFTSANTDLRQLGEAMKYAGPVASAAGVQFEEAAAALSMMGNAGIQGSMAGTSLRGAISRILGPTKAMQTAMTEAGLSFTDATGKIRPMAEIIEQLEPHADNAGLFMELFGQRAGPAMAALVSQGSGALRELTGELENSAGTAAKISAVQMEGFNGAMRELSSAFEGLQIAIAESGLIEWATELTNAVAKWVQEISKTNPELLKWGTIIAGLAAVLGPVILAVGLFATGIAAIGIPVAAAVAAVTAITVAVVAFWPEIVAAKDAVIAFAQSTWDRIEALPQVFVDLKDKAIQAFRDLAAGAEEWLVGKLTAVVDKVKDIGEKIVAPFRNAWDAVVGNSYIPDLVTGVEQWLGRLTQTAPALAAQAAGGVQQNFAGIEDGLGSMERVGQTVSSSIRQSFEGLIDGSKKVKDVLADLMNRLSDMAMDSAFQALFGASGRGGGGGLFGSVLGSLFGGGGGFISGGGASAPLALTGIYGDGTRSAASGWGLVGERGPELIKFRGGEQVVPNHALGDMAGGGQTVVRVEINGATGNNEVRTLVEQGVAAGIQRATPGIVQQSARHVQNARAADPRFMDKGAG